MIEPYKVIRTSSDPEVWQVYKFLDETEDGGLTYEMYPKGNQIKMFLTRQAAEDFIKEQPND